MRRRHSRPPAPRSSFAGFRFPSDVIVVAVRWYLRYGLSYRDVEELLAERGIEVDHVTIYRWVQRFTPLLIDAARPCRHATGDRWPVEAVITCDRTHPELGVPTRHVATWRSRSQRLRPARVSGLCHVRPINVTW